jgi:hypothetical protein
MSAPILQPSDTWILVALLRATVAGSRASLSELIRAADSVNHAVITRGELETGFTRLVAAGHASVTAEGFAPSGAVREFWMKETKSWSSLYKSWEKLAQHVGAESKRSWPLPDSETEQYVSKAAYSTAIEAYSTAMPHPFLGTK